jgi:hypothetical protein
MGELPANECYQLELHHTALTRTIIAYAMRATSAGQDRQLFFINLLKVDTDTDIDIDIGYTYTLNTQTTKTHNAPTLLSSSPLP